MSLSVIAARLHRVVGLAWPVDGVFPQQGQQVLVAILEGSTVQGQGMEGLEEVLFVGEVASVEVHRLVAQQELHALTIARHDGVGDLDGRLVVHQVLEQLGVHVRGLPGELDE